MSFRRAFVAHTLLVTEIQSSHEHFSTKAGPDSAIFLFQALIGRSCVDVEMILLPPLLMGGKMKSDHLVDQKKR